MGWRGKLGDVRTLKLEDPATGKSAKIEGVDVENVDGILVRGRTVWAVQNFLNRADRHIDHNLLLHSAAHNVSPGWN